MAKALTKDFRRPPGLNPNGVIGSPVLSLELERQRAWERGRAIAANLLNEMDKRLSNPPKPKRKPK
jgi:hypothetical protein